MPKIEVWQLAAGLGVGAFCFVIYYVVIRRFGLFKTSQLSREASAILAILIVVIAGICTILGLVLYAPKYPPPPPPPPTPTPTLSPSPTPAPTPGREETTSTKLDQTVPWNGSRQQGKLTVPITPGRVYVRHAIREVSKAGNANYLDRGLVGKEVVVEYDVSPRGSIIDQTRSWVELWVDVTTRPE